MITHCSSLNESDFVWDVKAHMQAQIVLTYHWLRHLDEFFFSIYYFKMKVLISLAPTCNAGGIVARMQSAAS